jgi:hypothetical protein
MLLKGLLDVAHGKQSNQKVSESNPLIEQEEEKVASILQAHTVVDPGAVMVHAQHTRAADRAMVGPCRFRLLALSTLLSHCLGQILRGLVPVGQQLFDPFVHILGILVVISGLRFKSQLFCALNVLN